MPAKKSPRIYFAAAIRGSSPKRKNYQVIIALLKKRGIVLSEFVGQKPKITAEPRLVKNIYNRDAALIRKADVVVAEVSRPSLGVGYELGLAEALGKKIYCLFAGKKEKLSAMVAGNSRFKIFHYRTARDLEKIISEISL